MASISLRESIQSGFEALLEAISSVKDAAKREFVLEKTAKISEYFDSEDFEEESSGAFLKGQGEDGMLSFDEFADIAVRFLAPAFKKKPSPKKIKRYFKVFDTDGNGKVDLKEFQAFLKYVALAIIAKSANAAGVKFDINKHNLPLPPAKITLDEIVQGFDTLQKEINKIEDDNKKGLIQEVIDSITSKFESEGFVEAAIQDFLERAQTDDTLAFPAFADLVLSLLGDTLEKGISTSKLRRMYAAFDFDGNEKIDVKEYAIFLRYVSLQMCIAAASQMGYAYDELLADVVPSPERPKVTPEDIEKGFVELIEQIMSIEDEDRREAALEVAQRVSKQFQDPTFRAGVAQVFCKACDSYGMLAFDDFVELATGFLMASFEEPPSHKKMRMMFDAFDADSNGMVDLDEFDTFLGYVSLMVCAMAAEEVSDALSTVGGMPISLKKITKTSIEYGFEQLQKCIQSMDEVEGELVTGLVARVQDSLMSSTYINGAVARFTSLCNAVGELAFDQFVILIIPQLKQVQEEPLTMGQLRVLFERFDADGNERIDVEEYQVFLGFVALQVCCQEALAAGIALDMDLDMLELVSEIKNLGSDEGICMQMIYDGYQQLLADIQDIPDADKREAVLETCSRMQTQFASTMFHQAAELVFNSQCGEDGMLGFEEFVDLAIGFMLPVTDEPPTLRRMKVLFQTFDTDHNGRVDAQEFNLFLNFVALLCCISTAEHAGVDFDYEACGLPPMPKPITEAKVDLGFARLKMAIQGMEESPAKIKVYKGVSKIMDKFQSADYMTGAAGLFIAKCGADGMMGFHQFVSLVLPIVQEFANPKAMTVMKLKDIFDTFDVDSNGRIDGGEYVTFLKFVALQVSARVAEDGGLPFSAAFGQGCLEAEPKALPPTLETIMDSMHMMSAKDLQLLTMNAAKILASRAEY